MALSLGSIPGDWVEEAACRDVDVEVFYPANAQRLAEARAICAGCPVIGECRSYIDRAERGPDDYVHGFAAGESARERKIRRRRSSPS